MLDESRLESSLRLSTLAGWNQTMEDWRRLLRLNPAGVGIWVDRGEVRASYSVMGYGSEVAWIGMILVDPEYRGTGLGKAAFQSALETASGFRTLGLDATDFGEPIYAKKGFETICPIVRWGGVLSTGSAAPGTPQSQTGFHDGILELDASCTELDRSALLADLAASNGTFLSMVRNGKTTAYAVVRPGRTAAHLGPVVAPLEEDLAGLLKDLALLLQGRTVVCDVLSGDVSPTLPGLGMAPLRHLKRMTLPYAVGCLCQPGVRFATGFEWG